MLGGEFHEDLLLIIQTTSVSLRLTVLSVILVTIQLLDKRDRARFIRIPLQMAVIDSGLT